jgi:hypothetical protein
MMVVLLDELKVVMLGIRMELLWECQLMQWWVSMKERWEFEWAIVMEMLELLKE